MVWRVEVLCRDSQGEGEGQQLVDGRHNVAAACDSQCAVLLISTLQIRLCSELGYTHRRTEVFLHVNYDECGLERHVAVCSMGVSWAVLVVSMTAASNSERISNEESG